MDSAAITTYARLCANASVESLRRHPETAPYVRTFFLLAKQHGLPIARAWLLGTLLFNSDADLHTPETATSSHPSPHPHSSYNQSTNRQLARLQQHIESASVDILHVNTGTASI